MDAESQVTQLEQALLRQAETLAREHRHNAEAARARILGEVHERLKLLEDREIMSAKAEAERSVRRQTQAAETRLAGELDRMRWALTEDTLSQVKLAFQKLTNDPLRYARIIENWLAAAACALPAGDLVVESRADDQAMLAPIWAELSARAAPGRKVDLQAHGARSEGGIRVLTADGRARLDQTFEARQGRLAEELARVSMERLFASAPDLGTLIYG